MFRFVLIGDYNIEQAESSKRCVTNLDGELRRVLNDFTVNIPTVGRPILQKCLQPIASGTVLPARINVIDLGDNLDVADWLIYIKAMGLEPFHMFGQNCL